MNLVVVTSRQGPRALDILAELFALGFEAGDVAFVCMDTPSSLPDDVASVHVDAADLGSMRLRVQEAVTYFQPQLVLNYGGAILAELLTTIQQADVDVVSWLPVAKNKTLGSGVRAAWLRYAGLYRDNHLTVADEAITIGRVEVRKCESLRDLMRLVACWRHKRAARLARLAHVHATMEATHA